MRILCCVKRVPAPGARINVTADGRQVDTAHLGFTTSPHEECAVEEAVRLTEPGGGAEGGTVTVLTLGPPEATEQLRYAASVGAHELALVPVDGDEMPQWDPQRTAAALVEAIGTLESGGDPFDLILMGNESADSGGFQVGVRVAHALGRPIVNGIKGIEVDAQAGAVSAQRAVDGGFERYRLPLPCVLGIKEGINLPRYPTMKGRLASKKAELASLDQVGTGPEPGGQAIQGLRQPAETVSQTEILGAGPEAAGAVVDLLDELGLL